jgi:hypothetical protein
MKKYAVLSMIALFFMSSHTFAQRAKKSDAEYKAMMTFDFGGKTWIYSHQEDKEGNVMNNTFFMKGQQFVLDYRKKNAYQVVTTAEMKKSMFRVKTQKDAKTKFYLRYYMLSCGFMDLYAPLSKEEKNTLHFDKGNSKLVFIAKK